MADQFARMNSGSKPILEEGTNGQQGRPSSASLNSIRAACGPDITLVPLENSVLVRLGMMWGAIPFNRQMAGEEDCLDELNAAGVECGGISGLMALAFPKEESLQHFLGKNPVLSGALATRFREQYVLWFKPWNRLPPTKTCDGAMIISTGIIPVYAPAGAPFCCSIYRAGRPLEVDLSTLTFTGALKDLFDSWFLQQKFGAPFIRLGGRPRRPNVDYWANLIFKMMDLQFNQVTGLFRVGISEMQKETTLKASELSGIVAGLLQEAGQQLAIRGSRIKEIIGALKKLCVGKLGAGAATLEFVRACVERRPHANLRKNEAAAACREFLKARGLAPAENQLRKTLSQALFLLLGAHESHSNGRVFRGLALCSGEVKQGSPPTLATSHDETLAEATSTDQATSPTSQDSSATGKI